MASAVQRRAAPRAELALEVTFARRRRAGHDVVGRTHDLGPGGMRVQTTRPLHVDEQLDFVLALDDGKTVKGRAHVIRHHVGEVYGLLFDRLADEDRALLAELASAPLD